MEKTKKRACLGCLGLRTSTPRRGCLQGHSHCGALVQSGGCSVDWDGGEKEMNGKSEGKSASHNELSVVWSKPGPTAQSGVCEPNFLKKINGLT